MMWDPNKSNLQLVMNIRDSDPYCFTHGDCFFGHRLRIGDIVISDGSKQFLFILSIKGRLEKQNNKNSELILHTLSKRVSDNPNYAINLAPPPPSPKKVRKASAFCDHLAQLKIFSIFHEIQFRKDHRFFILNKRITH